MKTMFTAFVAIFVIAFAANYGLEHAGFSAADQTTAPSVRLD